MPHPINQANENSPYGDLKREEFYKKHQILHQENFFLNQDNMNIFTQTWRPTNPTTKVKGLVAMVHGYTSDSGWISELTAVAIAKSGFLVAALDLQGHGRSDGFPGHIPDIKRVVLNCQQFFNKIKSENPNLPSFSYGESLGGAISMLLCLGENDQWDGLILNGAMCGISAKFKPKWHLEKLLPVAAFFAPKWKLVVSKPVAGRSYKEEWKRKLVAKNPNRRSSGKPPAATALEFLRVCEYIKRHCGQLEVGSLLMVHGEDDVVCDSESARFVYESAACKDKTLKVFPGMWHMLIGESEKDVDLVFGTILKWLEERATKLATKES